MKLKKLGVLLFALVMMFSLAACGSSGQSLKPEGNKEAAAGGEQSSGDGNAGLLNGAGSSFVNPLFSKMFSEYSKEHSDVKVNYQAIGSGGGIKQLTAKTVDFAASDAPMKEDEIKAAGGNVLHIPVTLGGVAIAYNLEGVKDLKLTPENLADIYNGKIKKWNDPKIMENNKGVKLPNADIFPVHRSDGSGTTHIFTTYLNKAVPDMWSKEQTGKSIKWANVGTGAKGNEGVAGQIQNTPGSIGYIELAYVIQNNMTAAQIKNKEGQFVAPSLESVTAAAKGALTNIPEDLKVELNNQPGKDSYPIVGTTWALVPEDLKMDKAKAEKMLTMLKWVVTDGQKFASDLQYAPLPKELQDKCVEQLKKVKVDGQPVLK
ncbi:MULTISPECIES: phosphate ABC transporter substrate-binding protein PstS [Aneurinibacillus]|uniref:Phosphate-binding protein n=1 Tax=Aneurinibacillus thermoaerophilus TaxID=143495 RepID=A0ABX8YD67_ANETH|nr:MULTISPECIES: phosphate ABC transporter substrate-binding protein PstS [Aneurinibacillus]MED0738746.1 phosphate ABC transporter substrate-binding protein PstS [Aneurinibacillus thermoaerophilus]MED0757847.1 phosphate ABC transporter substrate-binding protein PstS [Aneurinibacillus thermoaerophilus]MED0761977.1 phosphate ABC transporter substrate-binding protein PstS [Aneurinibacillus thermoaerophilus]QYY42928.1 phosphate ABC transporter substrate-binding protein PstS [Aneurinibacillus thermo